MDASGTDPGPTLLRHGATWLGLASAVGTAVAAGLAIEDVIAHRWFGLGFWRLAVADAWDLGAELLPAFVALGLGHATATPSRSGRIIRFAGLAAVFLGATLLWKTFALHALTLGVGRTLARLGAAAAAVAIVLLLAAVGRFARRAAPIGLVGPIAALVLAFAGARRAPVGGPDVLFIVVDTLRADHVGAWGAANPTTPNLDAFGASATRFARAYSPAPWTTPSMAGVLTGRQPGEFGYASQAVPRKLPRSVLLLPEILAAHGWRTAAFLSHSYLGRGLGFDQGYAVFDESEAQGHAWVSSPGLTERVLRYWSKETENPSFTLVHYFDPHFAYFEHAPWLFDAEYAGNVSSGEGYEALNRRAAELSSADIVHLSATYDSEIRFTDEHIGRLFAAVKASGRWDQTLVVVTGDHGEELCDRDPAWIGHGNSTSAEQTHVPLFVKYPGQTDGVVVEGPVGTISLLPTLLRAVSIAPPVGHRFDGPPLQEPIDRPVFTETRAYDTFHQAVALGRYRLRVDRLTGRQQLFDLVADPAERIDVAASEPGERQRLSALLDQFDQVVRAREQLGSGAPATFDDDERAMLEALGYAD